jgi:hypothetical protein
MNLQTQALMNYFHMRFQVDLEEIKDSCYTINISVENSIGLWNNYTTSSHSTSIEIAQSTIGEI